MNSNKLTATLPSDTRLLTQLEAKGCTAQLYARINEGVTTLATITELRLLADLMAVECSGTYRVVIFRGDVQAARFALTLRDGAAIWAAKWVSARTLRDWIPGAWLAASLMHEQARANGEEARTEALAESGFVSELRELGLIQD